MAAGDLKVPIARFAEPLLQEGEGLASQIRACLNAKRVHLGRRLRAYAMELCDRKRRHEGLSFVRQDRELAVWLAIVRCDLGKKLVAGNSGRGRKAGLLVDARPDFLGGLPRRRYAFEIVGYV